jgi:hypothetical protein
MLIGAASNPAAVQVSCPTVCGGSSLISGAEYLRLLSTCADQVLARGVPVGYPTSLAPSWTLRRCASISPVDLAAITLAAARWTGCRAQ